MKSEILSIGREGVKNPNIRWPVTKAVDKLFHGITTGVGRFCSFIAIRHCGSSRNISTTISLRHPDNRQTSPMRTSLHASFVEPPCRQQVVKSAIFQHHC
ncbi:hypothetical protein J4732_10900, partial [Serratia marcescens]|nr:hypothetical protein [Serratia marcescens]